MADNKDTGVVLPQKPIGPSTLSPQSLVIFSKPKVGKTTLLSMLPDCLLLDLEKGSAFVSAIKLEANNLSDIKAIGAAVIAAGKPYKYVAVDTATALEEMIIPMAENLYAATSMGAKWFLTGKAQYGSIINLPNGAGYFYLRAAFDKIIEYIKTWAPKVIILAHVKDTVLDKNGTEFSVLDLDLTGKIKRTTAAKADAIGYLYRKNNQNILSFKTSDDVSCGARPSHLRNQEIVVSEVLEDGSVVSHWDRIFID